MVMRRIGCAFSLSVLSRGPPSPPSARKNSEISVLGGRVIRGVWIRTVVPVLVPVLVLRGPWGSWYGYVVWVGTEFRQCCLLSTCSLPTSTYVSLRLTLARWLLGVSGGPGGYILSSRDVCRVAPSGRRAGRGSGWQRRRRRGGSS